MLFHKAKKELVAFPFNRDTGTYAIPDGIQSIGEYAFYCIGNEIGGNRYADGVDRYARPMNISFPASLKTIDDYAFWGAMFSNFTDSILPAEHIGNYAFAYSSLPDVSYSAERLVGYKLAAPQTIGDYAFFFCQTTLENNNYTNIDCKNLESIGEGAFMNSRDVKINGFEDSSVSVVASHAFDNSMYLPTGLPDTVQIIEEYALANNTKVSIQIPSRVKAIHSNAFAQSSGTISFADGSRLQSIGDRAFYEFKTNSSEIILPEGVETIGKEAFYTSTNKGVALLSVPASVTSIGDNVVNRTITVMQVEPGSYADIWASENGFPMQVDDTSWLFE